MRVKDQPPSLVVVAYALLIVSSITLVLGFWYMLRAAGGTTVADGGCGGFRGLRRPGTACPQCQHQVGTGIASAGTAAGRWHRTRSVSEGTQEPIPPPNLRLGVPRLGYGFRFPPRCLANGGVDRRMPLLQRDAGFCSRVPWSPTGVGRMILLKASNLVKRYGPRTVVDHVSFDVEHREVIGLLGRNGAGKTTTFRMVMA